MESVRKSIENLVDGNGSQRILRCMALSSAKSVRVPRTVVQLLLQEIDPEETNERKAHSLKLLKDLSKSWA